MASSRSWRCESGGGGRRLGARVEEQRVTVRGARRYERVVRARSGGHEPRPEVVPQRVEPVRGKRAVVEEVVQPFDAAASCSGSPSACRGCWPRLQRRAELAQLLDQRPRGDEVRAGTVKRVAEAREALLARLENVPRPLISRASCGGAVPRSPTTGVPCLARRSRSAMSGSSSRRKAGRRLMPSLMSSRRSAEGLAGLVRLDDPVGHPVALPRERAEGAVGVTRQLDQGAVLLGQDRQHASVCFSAGFARWMTAFNWSPRPARPAPSSLIRIEKRCR